jgi:hypothetical protein
MILNQYKLSQFMTQYARLEIMWKILIIQLSSTREYDCQFPTSRSAAER